MSFEEKKIQLNINAIPTGVPIGTLIWWFGKIESIPDGWRLCDGSLIEGEAYWQIRDILSSWHLPNLMSDRLFVRAGTPTGVIQEDTIRNIVGEVTGVANAPFKNSSGVLYAHSWASNSTQGTTRDGGGNFILRFDTSRVVPTSHENRPKNISALPLIKVL